MTPDQSAQHDHRMAQATAEGWAQWVRTVQDEHALLEGCYFDQAAAEHARQFFARFLRLPNPKASQPGEPKTIPFELLPWQWENVIAPLFGWKREDGARRFRHAWIEVAKKNGKSPLAAGVVLALLVMDGEPDPEVYSAATTREQAGIVFREAKKMVDRSPALQKVLEVREHVKRIINPRAMGFYSVLANKPAAVDGINAHGLIIDEIHRMPKRDLFDALVYSTDARRQPVQLIITTAGDDRASIGYELHERAEKIAAGSIIDTAALVYIAAADKEDDEGDPATWKKANPSLGVTVKEQDVAAEYERAKDSPARLQNFRRLRLNQWVTATSKWLDYDRWAACPPRCDLDELDGRECYGGLDMSSKYDLTSFVLQFPSQDKDGQTVHDVLAFHFLPEANIETQERLTGVPLTAWAEAGHLELTPGDYVDHAYVGKRIGELAEQYDIQQIAFDPAYCQQLAIQLADEYGLDIFEFWQRPTKTSPVLRYLESAIIEGRLRHGDNPLLNWQAGNIEVTENADGLVKPAKPTTHAKIDGVVALAMSMGHHCKQRETDEEVFTESPLIILG